MKDSIVAIKRTPEGLVAVVSRRQHDFWKALNGDNLVDLLEMYTFEEEPHERLKKIWPEYFQKHSKSWETISKVHDWDADLLYHVLMVLLTTVPVFPEKNLHLPILELETEKPVAKKTEANPRGILVRKGKKLKSRTLPEVDLRPYLCDPKNISAILYKLKPFWTDAIAKLRESKINIDTLNYPPAFTVEPYLTFHHSGSGNVKRTKLPQKFIQYLMFWLSNLPWSKVKKFLSLYYELGLEKDEALLGVVARLLTYAELEQALVWLQITRDLPSSKRYSFLLTLLETEAHDLDFAKYPPDQICELAKMIPYKYLEDRLEEMFWTFNHKVSIQYLEGGYRLAKKYGWNRTLELRHDFQRYPTERVESLIRWLKPEKPNLPFDIWENFGREKNWASVILRSEWKKWHPKTIEKYIELLDRWMDNQPSGKIKKRTFLKILGPVDTALESVEPEYQLDLLQNLLRFLWLWEKEYEFIKHLPRSCSLLIRLAKNPIPYSNLEFHYPLSRFIEHLTPSLYEQFLNAPDSSFTKMNKICQTDNKRRLLAMGLYILSSETPDLSVNAFCRFPGKLIQVCRRLGSLRFAPRLKTVKQFARHQLLKVDIDNVSPKQLVRLVTKYYQPGMMHPIPKKLQAHFNGEIKLSDTRIQGYHEKCKANYLSFIMDVLDRKTLQALSPTYPISGKNENWEHALQFFSWVDRNRRGFKNWFKAYLGGNDHYIENHPETKNWFSKHKRINKGLWNQGILFCRRTEKYGPVRIELESDPLEILKMGTYVGSCLSLGGHYAYSAVAVLLDLNKQVLYARDQNNKVLGRQLIALSENDELVCFDVYPNNAKNEIKNLFFEYDIDFAKSMDIDLYEGSDIPDQYYTIASILSQDWWDDYPWGKITVD